MLNKLHIYERFWTCLCPDKFNFLQTNTACTDCLHQLIDDVHCKYAITRMTSKDCQCRMADGCTWCKPDDYIFNEKTLKYEKK